MNLQELREYIRVQLDMDEEELPNALLDSYLQEGFLRTISMENRWPFYETRWNVAALDENIALPVDADPAGVTSLVDQTNGYRLMQVAYELAEDSFVGMWSTTSNPMYYSIYGGAIILWPAPLDDFARDYALRGQRLPTNWTVGGAGATPDCDVRLH
ncbi:MAG TPA: hypothetical protein VFQ26_09015, partial [Nitrospiraceae bacterium]|nr:hypothetical protein [Nitrospiraceae bacterium]